MELVVKRNAFGVAYVSLDSAFLNVTGVRLTNRGARILLSEWHRKYPIVFDPESQFDRSTQFGVTQLHVFYTITELFEDAFDEFGEEQPDDPNTEPILN